MINNILEMKPERSRRREMRSSTEVLCSYTLKDLIIR